MHAFFDESGDFRQDKVSWFSGFIAHPENWNVFSIEWHALLGQHQIPYLHATDFFSPHAPLYKGMEADLPRKIEIARDFAAVALRHAYWGYQVGVNAAAYKRHLPDAAKIIKADAFAFLRVLSQLRLAMEALGDYEDFLECYFDEKDTATRFYQSWRSLKSRRIAERRWFAAITFADDEFVLPLQAADLLCASAIKPAGDPIAELFKAPPHPIYGKQVLREVWDDQAFEEHPEIDFIRERIKRSAGVS